MFATTQLSMRFGAKILFKNSSLQFNPGNHYGLVGANGCGKSTFLKILAGDISPESGSIIIPQQLSLGTLKQDHFIYENEKIIDIVLRGNKALWIALEGKRELLKNSHTFSEQECEILTDLEKIIQEQGGYAAESEAAKLLEGLGIREEYHHQPLRVLSGGYKLRVLLAQVLFGRPEILLLDEPTNHLDLFSIKWLEGYLRNFPGILLVTSHDRDFLNGVCDHIVDFDYGMIKIYKGNYDKFIEIKKQERELKEALLNKHEKRRQDLQDFVDRFRAKATKARQAQSKARLVEKIEDEMDDLNLMPSSRIYPNIRFDPLRATGIIVLKGNQLSKSYVNKKVLENVSFELERGERLAIIGPNGIGKSTLLEILTSHIQADQGLFEWGFGVRPAYFPQDYAREVHGNITLLDWLGQFDRDLPQEKLRELLARVLFSGDTVNQSVQTLSGGETARLMLAKMMLQKPNVLIFDEPTNHLDMEAIDELTRALQEFDGTVLIVSHNRYFVSHIATRILEITFKGIRDFKCTYAEYIAQQEDDYLSAKGALSQRYKHEEPKNISAVSKESDYENQKRVRNLKAQLKKQIQQAEDRCHLIEQKLKKIDHLLAEDGYYQNTSREKQQDTLKQKLELDNQLQMSMQEWEEALTVYQDLEGS
jgi:ATPase subunit of ABC transporter with duplicated ATPase domains